MGVPIVALGAVHGEVFLIRDEQSPVFTREDMELVADLATTLGARLPALLARYAQGQATQRDDDREESTGAVTDSRLHMTRLAANLSDLLHPRGSSGRT